MKKYLSILLILMLSVTLFSCKKNAETDEPYIESVAGKKEETEDIKEKAEDDAKETDVTEENNNTVDENNSSFEDDSNDVEQQPENTQSSQENKETSVGESTDIQYVDEGYYDMQYLEEFSDLPVVPSIEKLSISAPNTRIYGYILPVYFYNRDNPPIIVDYNGSRYYYHENLDCFPKYTEYESVDLSKLSVTDEQVSIKRGEYGPTDATILEEFETGLVCKLPDDMLNNPYIDMLAVRRADGSTVLFSTTAVKNSKTLSEDKPIYDKFLQNNRVCASECLKSEDVEEVLLSYCQYADYFKVNKQVTLEGEKAQELYSKIIEFERFDENVSEKNNESIFISFRFKDGTTHFPIEYRVDLQNFIGCKTVPGFNEYILSLLK